MRNNKIEREFLNSPNFASNFFTNIIFYTFVLMILFSSINNVKLIILVLCIMLIEGIVLFIGLIFIYRKIKNFLKNCITTEGEVMEIINNKKVSKILVTFKTQNNVEIIFNNEMINNKHYIINEKIPVLYNLNNPNEAYINKKISILFKLLEMLLMSIGLIFISIYSLNGLLKYHL